MTTDGLHVGIPPRRVDRAIGRARLINSIGLAVGSGLLIGGAAGSSVALALVGFTVCLVMWLALADVYRALILFLAIGTLVPDFISFRVFTVTLYPARLALLVLLLALAIRWAFSRAGLPSWRTALNSYLFAFMGVTALSFLINAHAMTSAERLAGIRVCLFVLFNYAVVFVATLLVVRGAGPRAIPRIGAVLIVLLAIAGAVGVVEQVTGVNAYQFLERVTPSLLAGQGKEWGEYLTTYRMRGAAIRSSSTFTHFLDFGTAMAMGVPFTLHFFSRATRAGRRTLLGLALLLQTAGLVYSYSRGALLAVGLAATCYVLLTRDRKSLTVGLGAAALVIGLCLTLPGVAAAMNTVFFPQHGYASEGSLRSRLDDYGPMVEIIKEHPLLGLGPGMLLRQGFVTEHPQLHSLEALDNYYLVVIGETGMVGFAVFLALCWQICRCAWASPGRRGDPGGERWSFHAAIVSAVLAFLFLTATFDAWGFSSVRIFWVLIALGVAAGESQGRPAASRLLKTQR